MNHQRQSWIQSSEWDSVLPRRELLVTGGKIEARKKGQDKAYSATSLSDGERVIFYLIGEALSVPKNGIFIVDEPELHLHRAIQAKLWDSIESKRPDCLFVYLTHDLDFAASRKDQTKIWIREYSDGIWDWETLPSDSPFPESILLELLGSRNPILFAEGEKGSLDYFVYGKLLPDWTIVPCGSCEGVIHATKSFNAMSHLHENTCRGIIDFDSRTEEEIAGLQSCGIAVLPFSEIENLLLIEPLLRCAAQALCLDEDETIAGTKKFVLELLDKNREQVVSQLCAREIEGAFRKFEAKVKGEAALTESFQNVSKSVHPSKIYQRWAAEIGDVINAGDYNRALRYYSNKGLASQLGGIFKTSLRELIMRKLRSQEATPVIAAMHRIILPLVQHPCK